MGKASHVPTMINAVGTGPAKAPVQRVGVTPANFVQTRPNGRSTMLVGPGNAIQVVLMLASAAIRRPDRVDRAQG